ncbi:MAG TPA: cell wall hydrolase [Hyphomicrobiales bacterium]|nr:cell wall hydrolase [Hyphomicrobiales bacterium]
MRPLCLSRPSKAVAALLTLLAWPHDVAVQDIAALVPVPAGPALRARAHLVAAPPVSVTGALDDFDFGRGVARRQPALPGRGFVVSYAAPTAASVPSLPPEATRVAAAGEVLALPDGATPPTVDVAGTTPAVAAVPVATAALPVAGSPVAERLSHLAESSGALKVLQQAMLPPRQRARAEECMASAIYFEARGEPLRGQYAVAQVVMNRVRSGAYPRDVCDVIYQNADWRDHCQFSFACDGRREVVRDRAAWTLAEKVAKDVIERGIYLPDVGTATNYHADYVRPRWAGAMVKEETLGRHIFYTDPSLGDDPQAPLAFTGTK